MGHARKCTFPTRPIDALAHTSDTANHDGVVNRVEWTIGSSSPEATLVRRNPLSKAGAIRRRCSHPSSSEKVNTSTAAAVVGMCASAAYAVCAASSATIMSSSILSAGSRGRRNPSKLFELLRRIIGGGPSPADTCHAVLARPLSPRGGGRFSAKSAASPSAASAATTAGAVAGALPATRSASPSRLRLVAGSARSGRACPKPTVGPVLTVAVADSGGDMPLGTIEGRSGDGAAAGAIHSCCEESAGNQNEVCVAYEGGEFGCCSGETYTAGRRGSRNGASDGGIGVANACGSFRSEGLATRFGRTGSGESLTWHTWPSFCCPHAAQRFLESPSSRRVCPFSIRRKRLRTEAELRPGSADAIRPHLRPSV
mmetsp:Transcript_12809/g.36950  ORF Transcript_12809/g.36950 Transcript_12809/m.36950 type:complete len:370 (-) Transcript_12809:98-1207(-)